VWSLAIIDGHEPLISAIIFGLVVGKPVGIVVASAIAVRLKLAIKPEAYSWRQLSGAGALAGIGFTMSLFIASQAFPGPSEFAAAKFAVFVSSLVAGGLGSALLWARRPAVELIPERTVV